MYKWSLLLLACLAVFQPIASFTERNLFDGRQQCCDHQPRPLYRDTRLALYGTYRNNKLVSGDYRLNDQRNIPEIRRYEVKSVESVLTRESESPSSRRVVTDRAARFSRLDRRAVDRLDVHEQLSRRISQDRLSSVSIPTERDYQNAQIRTSRDDTTRVANERRSPVSIEGRREQRLLTRAVYNIRENRPIRLERNVQQRTRSVVVQASSYETQTEYRRQGVKDNNRDYRSLERRVLDVSETRLPLARSRTAGENRRIINDERRGRDNTESLRVTESSRVIRVSNIRDQTREDFRQERRSANPERRLARTDEREVRMGTRSESEERREGRQIKRIREDVWGSSVKGNRRNVRSTDSSLIRDSEVERRWAARFLDRRTNRALETRNNLQLRKESRNVARNDIRRVRDTRDERQIRDAGHQERRSLNQQIGEDRRIISMNARLNEIQKEDRVVARRDSRASRPLGVRTTNMEERIAKVMEKDRRFTSTRMNVRSNSQNYERERHAEIRTYSTDRRMERTRREAREGIYLARQARAVENLRSERRDTRFDSRTDTRNQRSLDRVEEKTRREPRERMSFARQARAEDVRPERRDTRFDSRPDTRNQRSLDRAEENTRRETRERISLARQTRAVENVRSERRDTRFDSRTDTRNQRNLDRAEENTRREARERISLARQTRAVENVRSERRDTRFDSRTDNRNQRSLDRAEENTRREARERISLARQTRSVENVRSDRGDTRFDSRTDIQNQRSLVRTEGNTRREARERMSLARHARAVENVRYEHRDTKFDSRTYNRNHRSLDRAEENTRREARERISLARLARAVENVRSERRDTRFNSRTDTRNQSLDRTEENTRREARDARITDERIQAVRESRNGEVRNVRSHDTSETRTRFTLMNKKTKQTSYVLNWQYLFYTLQGIYLCGVIIKMVNENPDKQKIRSWWGMTTKAIKVD